MCFYLTAILPKGTELEAINHVIEKHDMAFTPVQNQFVLNQLKPGDQDFRATKGHCDCGTVLGSSSTGAIRRSLLDSKKIKTLKRKGWNEEQINQWLDDKVKNKKITKGRKWYPELQENEGSKWVSFIRDLLDSGMVSRLGIIKHWYHGALNAEEFKINETQKIDTKNDFLDDLLNIDEDVLYEFYK